MFAGAIALLFLAGAIALLAGRALYGDAAAGRVAVGVVLPKEDALARQMVSMISSLDSVKSLCDFQYMEEEESIEALKTGKLSAVMDMPEGLIQGIMDGSNPAVRILLPGNNWLESRIFRELTEAGAKILGASQAGIYAGNELYRMVGMEALVPELERDLNQIFLSYSLPREDYFRHLKVSATGDVEVPVFYGISAYVLFLLLLAIPVSGYLLPFSPVMRRKLTLSGAGSGSRVWGKIFSLGSLFFLMTLVAILAAKKMPGLSELLNPGTVGGASRGIFPAAAACLALLLVCLAAASLVVVIYQAAGSLLGGIMLLFLTVTAQHFLAGGFLPAVFLPRTLQRLVPAMPSAVLMEGVQMILARDWSFAAPGKLMGLLLVCSLLAILLERREG